MTGKGARPALRSFGQPQPRRSPGRAIPSIAQKCQRLRHERHNEEVLCLHKERRSVE